VLTWHKVAFLFLILVFCFINVTDCYLSYMNIGILGYLQNKHAPSIGIEEDSVVIFKCFFCACFRCLMQS